MQTQTKRNGETVTFHGRGPNTKKLGRGAGARLAFGLAAHMAGEAPFEVLSLGADDGSEGGAQ